MTNLAGFGLLGCNESALATAKICLRFQLSFTTVNDNCPEKIKNKTIEFLRQIPYAFLVLILIELLFLSKINNNSFLPPEERSI
jgi:hypothetical protein